MLKNYKVTVNGKTYDVQVEELASQGQTAREIPVTQAPVAQAPATAPVATPQAPKAEVAQPAQDAPASGAKVEAPMPGKILKILVAQGDTVKEGQQVMVLEAMKMENEIYTTSAGKVSQIFVKEGNNVSTGDVLMVIA